MPRVEDVPPTESGKIAEIKKEYTDFTGGVSRNNVNEKLDKSLDFFIKKLAQLEIKNYELEQQIKELSKG